MAFKSSMHAFLHLFKRRAGLILASRAGVTCRCVCFHVRTHRSEPWEQEAYGREREKRVTAFGRETRITAYEIRRDLGNGGLREKDKKMTGLAMVRQKNN